MNSTRASTGAVLTSRELIDPPKQPPKTKKRSMTLRFCAGYVAYLTSLASCFKQSPQMFLPR